MWVLYDAARGEMIIKGALNGGVKGEFVGAALGGGPLPPGMKWADVVRGGEDARGCYMLQTRSC